MISVFCPRNATMWEPVSGTSEGWKIQAAAASKAGVWVALSSSLAPKSVRYMTFSSRLVMAEATPPVQGGTNRPSGPPSTGSPVQTAEATASGIVVADGGDRITLYWPFRKMLGHRAAPSATTGFGFGVVKPAS